MIAAAAASRGTQTGTKKRRAVKGDCQIVIYQNGPRFFAAAAFLVFVLFSAPQLTAQQPTVPALLVGKEYHITFDNGETIRNGKILQSTETEYEIQIRGLSEKIRVKRSTVAGAEPVAEKPPPNAVPSTFFRQWDIQILADLHLGLAAFANFDRFFPAVGLGINTLLTHPLPYIRVNSFHGEISFMPITDGERTIYTTNAVVVPRILIPRLGIDWYVGAGGGLALLQLRSYTFTKTSYTWLGRLEFGGAHNLGKNFRVYAGFSGTYWQDSLELLLSVNLNLGLAYVF